MDVDPENRADDRKEFIDPVITVPFFLWLAQAVGSAVVGFFTWELLAWWKKRKERKSEDAIDSEDDKGVS